MDGWVLDMIITYTYQFLWYENKFETIDDTIEYAISFFTHSKISVQFLFLNQNWKQYV